jgi:hydrogenase maturation protein HypF
VVKASDIVEGAAKDIAAGVSPQIVSARFHNAVLDVTLDVVQRLRTETGINEVALSGGVWQNARLLSGAIERLSDVGMTVHAHRLVPTNDGGVSLGQAVVVACGGGIVA